MSVPVRPSPALQCTAMRPGSDSESSRNWRIICSDGTPPSMKYLRATCYDVKHEKSEPHIHLNVFEAIVSELTPVVALFVESHDSCNVQLLEDVCVVLRSPRVYTMVNLLPRGCRAAERDEFARDDYVEVPILDALVILIELNVKRCKVDEVQIFGALKTGHAVSQSERVCADTVTCISVWKRGRGSRPERLHGVLGRKCLPSA
jgi:hypothetical protein